ncbi:MAG TPA: MarR family transcriptional regulator [Methylomusa anaerophila]|uniref:MarR family winged helix-turn-helix transcriptional regulator n=1 Tax=Methylomusa anaerophila TaxID=1930071 RepID=UPI002C4EB309|nr:MarR family transcriptional regulator [Methylomusa anaerophila]HML89584.1 MarR family transcriptional regulator [Methylomusa anaerophila]
MLQNIFEDVFSMHFARYGLSWPKYKVLINLYMSGDYGLIQSELSAKLLVSRANITSLIERLEKEDLVIRRNDSADKRVFRVYLSNRAVALMHAFLPIHNDFVHKAMSSLSTSEKKELIFLLKKLNTGLD